MVRARGNVDAISIDDVLFGVGHGRSQSVGNMEVIPLIDEENVQDNTFASPDEIEIGTQSYGTVDLRNPSSSPTIVPPGAAWVVKQAAQDHAIGSGAFMGGKSSRSINTAMCIQSNQGGGITRGVHDLLILPAQLRSKALALRNKRGYEKLWSSIGQFNAGYGLSNTQALEYFLSNFGKQLDRFVAEFEIVPNQIGAIVLINGQLVGVEMAPSVDFWNALWTPLIRLCYGSLSIRMAQQAQAPNRTPLQLENRSLDGVVEALMVADRVSCGRTERVVAKVREGNLLVGTVEEKMDKYSLTTVASPDPGLGGQIVLAEGVKTAPYLSVCAGVR